MWVLLGVVFYFITRFIRIQSFPLFTDEAIYLYWSKLIQTGQGSPFISIIDGKPPFFLWLQSVFLLLFPLHDFLVAGRIVSVLSGFLTLIGVYVLSLFLSHSKVLARIAVFFYILIPYSFVYDRLALMDSLLTTMIIWSVYFFWKYIRTIEYKYAIAASIVILLAYLTKPAAVLILLFWGIIIIFERPKITKKMMIGIITAGLGFVIAFVFLRFSDSYSMFVQKNQQFQRTGSEILSLGLEGIVHQILMLLEWVAIYLTVPIFLLLFIGFVGMYRSSRKNVGIFLSIIGGSLLIFSITGKILFPRYIAFLTPFFAVLLGYAVIHIWRMNKVYKFIGIGLLFIGVCFMAVFQIQVMFTPIHATYPQPDYDQFIGESPSGYALEPFYPVIDEAVKNNEQVTIITDGTFGLLPYSFTLRYWNNPKVTILPIWPLTIPAELDFNTTYFVIKKGDGILEIPVSQTVLGEDPHNEVEYTLYKL